jgi:hydrogenase expression/formation protein HypE
MHELIRELFLEKLNNPVLRELSDSASLNFQGRLAFTTDSFVVHPLFFPGADIGKLAVCGTVNDLVMAGAEPRYLSLAFIIEEGLDRVILERIVDSVALHAARARVTVVTGDIKVVEKGACDKIFINTSGIGRIIRPMSLKKIRPGDKVILSGDIGRHGLAVLTKRKELGLGFDIKSDCAALSGLINPILKKVKGIKFMRDPTRGGLAATLSEIVTSINLGVVIEEKSIPVPKNVQIAAELLGIDPLYVANEGRAVLIVEPGAAKEILLLLRKQELGRSASIIGEISARNKGRVILNTKVGSSRIIELPEGEQLPRIC